MHCSVSAIMAVCFDAESNRNISANATTHGKLFGLVQLCSKKSMLLHFFPYICIS
jgi:hypothetical protein